MYILKQHWLFKRKALKQPFVGVLAVLLFISPFMGFTCDAQEQPTHVVDSNFHIYLLMGQSNMAGRGKITEKFKAAPDSNILSLDKQGKWIIAKHPLHFDKAIAGVGPGLKFAQEMLKRADKEVKIGLVPCAVGGTSINKWKIGAYDRQTHTHPYDDAIARIKQAMQSGVIKGVIWHQGESDQNNVGDYLPKLQELIRNIRSLVQNPNLPFVVGELGQYNDAYHAMNVEIRKVKTQVPVTAVVSTKGLKDIGDHTHFDSASATKLGKRYAKAMKQTACQKKAGSHYRN
jgi:hypothetical protein